MHKCKGLQTILSIFDIMTYQAQYVILPCVEYFRDTKPRWSVQVANELAKQHVHVREASIAFGEIIKISAETTTEEDMKSVKDRPPTPVVCLSITHYISEIPLTD